MSVLNRWLIGITLVAAGAAAGYGWGAQCLEKYESTGVLLADLELADYKKTYELLSSNQILQAYPFEKIASPVRERIQGLSQRADPLKNILTPVYRATRAEVRDLGDFRDSSKAPATAPVLGLRIALRAHEPSLARDSVGALADVMRSALLKDALSRWVLTRNVEVEDRMLRADAQRLKNQFDVEQARQKISDLKRVVQSYPQAASLDARQIVTLGGGNANGSANERLASERFLSPTTQIVAEETRIIDLNRQQAQIEREQQQFSAERTLLTRLRSIDSQAMDGAALAEQFQKAITQVLDPLAADQEAVRETRATYLADLEFTRAQWLEKTRFISGPDLPLHTTGLNRIHTMVFGALMALLLVLAIFFRACLKRGWRQVQDVFGLGHTATPEQEPRA